MTDPNKNSEKTEEKTKPALPGCSCVTDPFAELPPETQGRLLEHGGVLLRDPSLRPVLLRVYDHPPPDRWRSEQELRELVARHLRELDRD